MKLASDAMVIRRRYLPGPIIARKVSISEFLHSLGQKRKSSVGLGMSVAGGRAEVISAKADIQTAPDSHAYPSVSARLWFGGLRPRDA